MKIASKEQHNTFFISRNNYYNIIVFHVGTIERMIEVYLGTNYKYLSLTLVHYIT